MTSLRQLQERRAHECRLTPDRELESLDEAEEFLRDRGLLTRTADCALPSLHEACHEDAYAPEGKGFAQWPATKWWWFGALEQIEGVSAVKVHRGKSLLVTAETAALFDPICRAEIERMHSAGESWARLLDHLAEAGPSELGDLQTELELKPRELKAIRSPLERYGAVVARSVVHQGGAGHTHTSELARWDQVFPEPSSSGGGEDLLVAAVRAAVITPEPEVQRWFSWTRLFDEVLVDRLVEEERLFRPEPGWLAAADDSGGLM